jgi:hypothetical protein
MVGSGQSATNALTRLDFSYGNAALAVVPVAQNLRRLTNRAIKRAFLTRLAAMGLLPYLASVSRKAHFQGE